MTSKIDCQFNQTEIGFIPQDWIVSTIEEIASPQKSALAMGPFGSNITKNNFIPSGVPVIRGNNLTAYRFLDSKFVFVSEKKADELRSSNAKSGDIVITHRGTLGQVGIIPERSNYMRYIISQSGMKLTCDKSKTDPDFVFYWLKSPKGQQELLKNTSQTGVPAIAQPLASLRKVKLPLPSLPEQKRIAKFLTTLNRKIELNQQMNRTLEAVGRAVFKRWFVDFEFPNEEGKPYKSSGGEMLDSELGEIPQAWQSSKIGKVLTTVLGGTPERAKKEYWENGDIPWTTSGRINEFRIIEPSEYITKKGLDNSAAKIMPKRTTVLAVTGATLGQVSLLEIESSGTQNVIGILGSTELPPEYVYFWTKHIIKEITASQTGGAQQHINKEIVNNSLILIPDEIII